MEQARIARRVASTAFVFFTAILAVSCSRPAADPVYRPQMHAAEPVPTPTPERPSLEIVP